MINNITPIFTIIGIVIGWILTQFAQWYKGRKEDNRIRKEVLYYLLEIRYTIPRLNIMNLVDSLVDRIINQLPEQYRLPETRNEILKDLPATPIVALLKSQVQEPFIEAEKNYKLAVQKLSSVNPILAYKLSGKTTLLNYANYIIDHINTLPVDGTEPFNADAFKKFLTSTVNNRIIDESINDFNYFIKNLAWKINPFLIISIRKILKQVDPGTTFDEEDNKLFDNIFSHLKIEK